MNNKEYEKIVNSTIKKENSFKNVKIAFLTGGLMGLIGEILYKLYLYYFNITINDAYLLVFITIVVISSVCTGLGFFDKVLSYCKCGLIVPCSGFANSMTSSAMDYRREGFIKGFGSNIFKLTGSVILYGVIFGIIFGYIRSIL